MLTIDPWKAKNGGQLSLEFDLRGDTVLEGFNLSHLF